jgi:hypothetical protein
MRPPKSACVPIFSCPEQEVENNTIRIGAWLRHGRDIKTWCLADTSSKV